MNTVNLTVRKLPQYGIAIELATKWHAGQTLVKLKSPHYLTKKFLMRMNKVKTEAMFADVYKFKETIDEEFYSVAHKIVRYQTLEQWQGKTDQERRAWIEDYFEDRQS